MYRVPWSRGPEPPDPLDLAPSTILLASEGRAFPAATIDFTLRLAKTAQAAVHVLSIARQWGSPFGLPHPGLMPTKRELQIQRDLVAAAVLELQRADLDVSGQVIGTRAAAKRIVAAAKSRNADAIVMTADAPRHWLVADMMWSQEPYRVRRYARIPVYLITQDQPAPAVSRSASTGLQAQTCRTGR